MPSRPVDRLQPLRPWPRPWAPRPAQQFLARLRHSIDPHTDQVIIIVSLLLGFWLIANSIYCIVT